MSTSQKLTSPRTWLRLLSGLVVLSIVCGVFFRFYHVDKKVYWDDEIYTSLRILGATEAEWVSSANQIVDANGLRALLHPAVERPVADTVRGLASEDPQHSPLYYVVAHYWIDVFGNSVAATRLLSAIVGLFALPAAYWLGLELFAATIPAWMLVAFVALSPVLVLYSQEAREYSLFSVLVLLTWATFLRAQRLGTGPHWTLYGFTLLVALYVYPTAALIALAGLIYLLAIGSSPRTLVRALVATCVPLLCFAPWLYVMVSNRAQIRQAAATVISRHESAIQVLRLFFANLRHDYLDFNLVDSMRANIVTSLPVLALLAYALYVVWARAERRVSFFILSMLVLTAVPLVLLDMVSGGGSSGNARYFLPLYLAFDLALACAIYAATSAGTAGSRTVWQGLCVAVLAGRLASCAVSSQAETWWNKLNEHSIDVARAINATQRPLLAGDDYIGWALSLSNYLDPKVRVELRPRCYLCHNEQSGPVPLEAALVPDHISDVFLIAPSERLKAQAASALERLPEPRPLDHCIDVRRNCVSSLNLW